MIKNLKFDQVKYNFFSSKYGCSPYPYESLNCGQNTKDLKKNIFLNRCLVKQKLGFKNLFFLNQIHSDNVYTLTSKECLKANFNGDGVVTNISKIGLCILTADCASIFFIDNIAKIIGACHAGWRGALNGIIENTINNMLKIGSSKKNIHVIIGPTIQKYSYQIGSDLEHVIKRHEIYLFDKKILLKINNNFYFDLPLFIKNKILIHGINKIRDLNIDTYINKNYFSHRRSLHNGIGETGRQVSIIGLL